MPNLPNWKPPIAVRPITAEAFVGLATYIDLGCKAVALNDERVAEGCESGCMPNTSPRLGDMAATLYTYIPTSSLPWDEVVLAPGMAAPEDDGDRASHYTFRFGRAKLLGVLAGLTPESVKKELGDVSPGLSDAPDGGATWWAISMAAGGALFWLAKRNLYVATASAALPYLVSLARVVGVGLVAAGASGIIPAIADGASWVFEEVAVKPVAKATNILGYAAGIGGAALVGFVVWKYVVENKPTKKEPRAIAG